MASTRPPPGTVLLEDLEHDKLVLQPRPSEDPEQPLNWSVLRKTINFSIVCFYALMAFVILDIGTVVWGPMNEELGISFTNLSYSFAANCAGLAVGCFLLVPLSIKIGRRPVYIISTLALFLSAIWMAKTYTVGDNIGNNITSGIFGAISESIVQMTIADLFFVHQRARMNAIYVIMVDIGTFLAPVAAGYCSNSQGWRWINWWTAIFFGVLLLAMIFAYEETKYTVSVRSTASPVRSPQEMKAVLESKDKDAKDLRPTISSTESVDPGTNPFQKKNVRQRFALVTLTPGGSRSFLALIWDFIVLLKFPAVAYTALMWGATLTWFSVILNTLSIYFVAPPYNFSAAGIGLLNLPPFIGGLIAIVPCAYNDYIIIWLAKRNGGVFEPEMRLWLALLGVVVGPAGLCLFGLSLAQGMHWIVPCIGSAFYGAGLSIIGTTSLTYLQDSYAEVIGDALVPVTFVRNALATMVVFALTPWINTMGLYNMFVCATCLAFALYALTVPMLIWGKTWRVQTAAAYARHIERSGNHASIS
ncbi:hypothetical protein LTS14_010444 [Recurvomyces mirabilis]|nr:hypothetical protein LTS14_010444 [Recurvomyces mirabilis]